MCLRTHWLFHTISLNQRSTRINRRQIKDLLSQPDTRLSDSLWNHWFTLQSVYIRKNQTSPKQLSLTPAFIILNQFVQYNFATQNEAPNYLAAAYLYSHHQLPFPPASLLESSGTNKPKKPSNYVFYPKPSPVAVTHFPLNRPLSLLKNKPEKRKESKGSNSSELGGGGEFLFACHGSIYFPR